MDLAGRAGLNVAPPTLVHAAGRDVLLVERFDRNARRRPPDGRVRRNDARAGPVPGRQVRQPTTNSPTTCEPTRRPERRSRAVRPHHVQHHRRQHRRPCPQPRSDLGRAAPELAPAFDICPQPRSGGETQQAMDIGRDGYKAANLAGCVHGGRLRARRREAFALVERQIQIVHAEWSDAADRAGLNAAESGRRGAVRSSMSPSSTTGSDVRPKAARKPAPTLPNGMRDRAAAGSPQRRP